MKKLSETEIKKVLEKALEEGRKVIPDGHVATYIPQLGLVDPNLLGITIVTKDGDVYSVGDCDTRFTIQSISKTISLTVALELCGREEVFSTVGMEPSGEAFNSMVELDLNSNKPYNPMINSGAIAVESLIIPKASFSDMLLYTKRFCDDMEITIDDATYASEMSHSARNRAIAYLLQSKDIIKTDVDDSMVLYTRMCSLSVTSRSLANLALLFAMGGVSPKTGERLISAETCRIVKTIMMTCGMYDGSGEFAVEVGIPTKSGVGGGLLSVVDKELGIGIYGPSLDAKGNSIAGKVMLKYLADELELHLFS